MSETAVLEERAYTFNAFDLSRAWLAVSQASGKDEDRPALSRTVLVEFYDEGVRLVATDGYILLTAWIPEYEMTPAPEVEEAPNEVVIARDTHGRGAGLMAHLRKLAEESSETGLPLKVAFRVGEPPADPTETLELEGLEQRALVIDHPGREELALPLFEGEYPQWRSLLATHESVSTKEIALNPEIIGRLAKLGKFYDMPLIWRFGGPRGAALLEIGPVAGAAMPVRWPGIGGLEGEQDLGEAEPA